MVSEDEESKQVERKPSKAESVAQTGVKKTVEGAQVAASVSADIVKIADQSINPAAGLAAAGATAIQIAADSETSTNVTTTKEERRVAAREVARGSALLVTDVCVGIGYNCAADVETLGVAAVGTGNAIGIERTVNEMSAKLANYLELPHIQEKLGLGDGAKYKSISDMPVDAVMSVGGYQVVEKLAEYRGKLEESIEKKTGLSISDLHHVTHLGARLAEAGLNLVAGEPPDFDAITVHAEKLAEQVGIDSERGKDLKAVCHIVAAVGNVAKHIDQGEFGFNDLSDIAKASSQVASRAQAHGITPKFAKDAKAVAELTDAVCTVADNVGKGDFNPKDVKKLVASSNEVIDRLQDREIISPKTTHDLQTAAKGVEVIAGLSQGRVNTQEIADVTQRVVQSAQSHGLVGEETVDKITKVTHKALSVTQGITELTESVAQVQDAVKDVKAAVKGAKNTKAATVESETNIETETVTQEEKSDDLDKLFAEEPSQFTPHHAMHKDNDKQQNHDKQEKEAPDNPDSKKQRKI